MGLTEEELFAARGMPYAPTRGRPEPLGIDAHPMWQRIERRDGHWIWTGPKDSKGYPMFTTSGRLPVHRFIWEQLVGPIEGLLRKRIGCGIRHCVFPDHWIQSDRYRHLAEIRGSEAANLTPHARAFRERRTDAIDRSIPFVEVDTPLLIHKLSTAQARLPTAPGARNGALSTVPPFLEDGTTVNFRRNDE